MKNRTCVAAVAAVVLGVPAAGAQAPAVRDSGLIVSSVEQAVTQPVPRLEGLVLEVDLSERMLYVRDGERVVKRYPVAVGAADHPTPRGEFRVGRLIWNPSWTPPRSAWARNRKPAAPGEPGNPMGRVKIFFRDPDYYIHGTGAVGSLGRAASHGCVRMRDADAAELARLVMEHGGAGRDEAWYRQVVRNRTSSRPVALERAVTLRIRA